MAPRELASTLQSLPPIPHKQAQSPVQSYSKGSRVFRLAADTLHLHSDFNFTGLGGDSAAIVTPFVQVGTYPTRYFATLGPL